MLKATAQHTRNDGALYVGVFERTCVHEGGSVGTWSAGMLVSAPTANARHSDAAAAVIVGPTSCSTMAAVSSTGSAPTRMTRRSHALEMMNMLSTPMASTKNGTTSVTIIVIDMPGPQCTHGTEEGNGID